MEPSTPLLESLADGPAAGKPTQVVEGEEGGVGVGDVPGLEVGAETVLVLAEVHG